MNKIDPYSIIEKLWPINRSLGGYGFRKSLKLIRLYIPALKIRNIPSGLKLGSWKVPLEWHVVRARLYNPNREKILDYFDNDLTLVSYSKSFKASISLSELKKRIFSIPSIPNAIPYRTSYYKKDWGFCMSDKQKSSLQDGKYLVDIKTEFRKGNLNYGELFLKGETKTEVIFSTYLCHPQMVSNELSGPALLTCLARFLLNKKKLYYSYRFFFSPETIGAIYILNRNLEHMQKNVLAGFICTCLADKGDFSLVQSPNKLNYAEKMIRDTAKIMNVNLKLYEFLDRGSDERQYLSPAVNLPFCTLTRSKFGEYPEYHTHLDNFEITSRKNLSFSLLFLKTLVKNIESHRVPISRHIGEPHYSRYRLRRNIGAGTLNIKEKLVSDLVAYSNGSNNIEDLNKILRYSDTDSINKTLKILIKSKIVSFR